MSKRSIGVALLLAAAPVMAGADEPMFKAAERTLLSHQTLAATYRWNRKLEAYGCGGKPGGIASINGRGEHVLIGGWCIGNLRFSGNVTVKAQGLELAKGTTMVYPPATDKTR